MSEQQAALWIVDGSRDRKYFTIVPNIIWEKGLTAIEFALYSAIKRVAGDQGECFMGTRRLAELAGIGAGSVSRAKKVLAEKGLIQIVSKKRTARGQPVDHIIVIDIWAENMTSFAERSTVEHLEGERSTLEHQCSTGEHQCSTGETEEDPLKKNLVEEEGVVLDESFKELCRLYENTCGTLQRTIAEGIRADFQEYPNMDWWRYGFKQAALANARNYRYVIAVVQRVARDGIGPPGGAGKRPMSKAERRERYLGGKYGHLVEH